MKINLQMDCRLCFDPQPPEGGFGELLFNELIIISKVYKNILNISSTKFTND